MTEHKVCVVQWEGKRMGKRISIGFLINETPDMLHLASTLNPKTKAHEFIVIPKKLITMQTDMIVTADND